MGKKTALEEALNEVRWSKSYDFKKLKIYYIHRDSERSYQIMLGDEIESYNRNFIVKRDGTMIPTHRVFLVTYEERVLYRNDRKFPSNFNLYEEERRK